MTRDQARRVFNALLTKLEGRSGFDILNMIHGDDEVYNEMYESLVDRTIKAYEAAGDPRKSHWFPYDA